MHAELPPTNLDAFAKDLDALLERTRASLGPADLAHLRRVETLGRAATVLGYLTAPWGPNPLSMIALSIERTTRWTMVAHHVLHKGYDRVPGVPIERTAAGFAAGWRRFVDWLDWLTPEAWVHEHNRLHHYRLNEAMDPDVVEHNLEWLRAANLPRAMKLAVIAFFASTWKASYYAPNTLRMLLRDDAARAAPDSRAARAAAARTLSSMWKEPALYRRCLAPYVALVLLAPALLALPLGALAALSTLVNSLGAEVLTNLHSFVIITTNHAGDDIEAYGSPVGRRGKGMFYRRQVVGSVNFATGGFVRDFLHGFLNYQIEHHLFPDLPMAAYARIQPEVKAICERHGVPYKQQSVFARLRKTLDIMTGRTSMIDVA